MKNKSKQLISTLDEELRKKNLRNEYFFTESCTELLQIAMIILNKF